MKVFVLRKKLSTLLYLITKAPDLSKLDQFVLCLGAIITSHLILSKSKAIEDVLKLNILF